jgi:hypothetical protein
VFACRRLIWARRQGLWAKASRECHQSVDHTSACSSDFLTHVGLCTIVTWLSLISVRSCRVSVRSSLGTARSLSDHVGPLSDRHLAQPDLCPIVSGLCLIVIWLNLVFVRSCRVSIRSSFCSASFLVWCVAGPIHSVICFSGQVLSLISNVVFLAPFQVSGAVPSTVLRADS